MAEIELAGTILVIRLRGLNKASASFNGVPLQIPLAHITGVTAGRSTPPPPTKEDLGPNVLFGSQLSWSWSSAKPRHLERAKEFKEAGLDPFKVIEIGLANEDYTTLVLRVDDPVATAAWIMEAVRAHRS